MTHGYSVVIPAYNAEANIGDALTSVMQQTIAPKAIIVVDDGSADRTAAVSKSVCVAAKVIRKQNGGPGSATTVGLQHVRTDYVATLDADDFWLPMKMERQLAVMEKDLGFAGIFSLAKIFQDGAKPDPDLSDQVVRLWTRTTMLYRMDAARHIGEMVDFPGKLGDLIDWLSRGRELGHRHLMIEEVLAMRRKRVGSLSDTREDDRLKGYLHALREHINRQKVKNPTS